MIIASISWVHLKNPEIHTAGEPGRSSLGQIPVAILNLVRNAVFRITISLGGSFKLNFTELLLGCAYIATLFTWALINSKVNFSASAFANYPFRTQLPTSKASISRRNITPIEQD